MTHHNRGAAEHDGTLASVCLSAILPWGDKFRAIYLLVNVVRRASDCADSNGRATSFDVHSTTQGNVTALRTRPETQEQEDWR